MKAKAAAGLVIAVLVLTATTPTKGDDQDLRSTETLLGFCKQQLAFPGHSFCLGYVSGIAGMMEEFSVKTTGAVRQRYGMCVSSPYPSANAEVQAFINWAEKNPRAWGLDMQAGVILALSDTWPCAATK